MPLLRVDTVMKKFGDQRPLHNRFGSPSLTRTLIKRGFSRIAISNFTDH